MQVLILYQNKVWVCKAARRRETYLTNPPLAFQAASDMEYWINDSWPAFLPVQLTEMPLIFSSILYTHATIIITPQLVSSNSRECFSFLKNQINQKLQNLLYCYGFFSIYCYSALHSHKRPKCWSDIWFFKLSPRIKY